MAATRAAPALQDPLIAATALGDQAGLDTRKVREFAGVPGLRWQNGHAN